MQRRALSVDASGRLETRANSLDERVVEGYAVIWGVRNRHGEKFFRGAFAKSIQEHGPESNANYRIKYTNRHGHALALMDVLKEDEVGLYFRTKPLDKIQEADDHLVQLRSGTLNNFSVGFNYIWEPGKMAWNEAENGIDLYEAILYEMGGVDVPSDMETFAKRSLESADEALTKVELFIKSLPQNRRMEARKLFADYETAITALSQPEPQQRAAALSERSEPPGIDYNYLINNLKF